MNHLMKFILLVNILAFFDLDNIQQKITSKEILTLMKFVTLMKFITL